MKMNKRFFVTVMALFLSACDSPEQTSQNAIDAAPKPERLASVDEILVHSHDCSPTITIRFQSIEAELIQSACIELTKKEAYFHQVFGTENKPVKDDNNHRMRANFYISKQEYNKYAGEHFNIPVDNGGMYLEGIPSNEGNEAEFIAYLKNGILWNLEHEYIHYLDGRFNAYGDFCDMPHDSHSPPEYCPEPHPPYPHFVWWSEGVAEYIANPLLSERIIKRLSHDTRYKLSELFNTSYEENNGGIRIYTWGYLSVRFMMEVHRSKIDEMLVLTRIGDWEGYRRLVTQWGTSMDAEFEAWLNTLKVEKVKNI